MIDSLGAPQSVLVLGAGSDIARATVARFAERGRLHTAVLAGRTPDALAEAADEARGLGIATVRTEPFDAARPETHAQFFDHAFADRPIDVVLLAFGVLPDQARAEHDVDYALDSMAVNYAGAASATLHSARRLRDQGSGVLVVLSSVAAERARASNYVYGSAKAGLDALATGLGDSLHGTGASVMVVRPGFVHSKMTAGLAPAPLATTPDVVAAAIASHLRSGSTTVWVPGGLRTVMSGLRHLPRPLFRRLGL